MTFAITPAPTPGPECTATLFLDFGDCPRGGHIDVTEAVLGGALHEQPAGDVDGPLPHPVLCHVPGGKIRVEGGE